MNPQTPDQQTTVSSPTPQKHIPRGASITVLVLVIVIVLGYSALAFTSSPEGLLAAIDKRADIAKNHVEFTATVSTANKDISGATVTLSADVDRTLVDNPSMQANVKFEMPSMSADADLKLVNEVAYVRLNSVPAAYTSVAQSVLGTWYAISREYIEKLQKERNISLDTSETAELNSARIESLLKVGVISDISFAGVGTRNGNFERLYSIGFDKNAVKSYIQSQLASSTEAQTSKYSEEILDQVLSMIVISDVTAGVGFFDGVLKSIDFDVTFSDPKGTMVEDGISLHIAVAYSESPSDLVITAPAQSTSLEALVEQSLQQARSKGADAAIKANLSNLRVGAEVYYDSELSYVGFCNGTSSYAKGVFANLAASNVSLTCRTATNDYLIAAPLRGESSGPAYYCVDAKGNAGVVAKIPTGWSCK